MKQLELFPELDIIRYAMSLTAQEVLDLRLKRRPEASRVLEIRMLTQRKIGNIRREQERYKQEVMKLL